jgi:hypothetical protein
MLGAAARRSKASVSGATPKLPPPWTYLALPSDLPRALQSLDEADLNALLRDVTAEAQRRRQLSANAAPTEIQHRKVTGTKASQSPVSSSQIGADKIPTGKANLIRAAFKAGVTPAAIAREFRISQSVVRGVLASLKNTR